MIPYGIKDRFELYQKWFKTLLIKEFLNLPTKYQEKFLTMGDTFLKDCKKIHQEGKEAIEEKIITLTITEVFSKGTNEKFKVYCRSSTLQDKVVLSLTFPEPKIGDKLCYVVYRLKDNLNENVWYSSKEELINNIKGSLL